VSTLAQVLPSVATVSALIVGALITGFGAAPLKHRWDAGADETRWRRGSAARLRAQRLEAFGRYLTARPDLAVIRRSRTRRETPPASWPASARLAPTCWYCFTKKPSAPSWKRPAHSGELVAAWPVPSSRS